MLAATNAPRLAFIETISENGYTVAVYESADHRRRSDPSESFALRGSPNAADILARLGDGWHESDEIPADPPVPERVTARQIRLWLVTHGVSLAAVDAAIESIPDAMQREAVRVEWEYAPYVERGHPMLVPLAAALGMDEAAVDAAFIEAARL